MRLGIDGSNLRAGGGTTHLIELLRAASPEAYGVDKVTVWSRSATLERLEKKPWLEMVSEPMLEKPRPARLWWQAAKLRTLANQKCDILFAPGGNVSCGFKPVVTMCRNMLPFEHKERARYGITRIGLKLRTLSRLHARSLSKADGVIFLTQYAKNVVENEVMKIASNRTIIPHGVNEIFRLEPRVQKSLSRYSKDRPFRWLYVSIIDRYKHQWNVAEAVAQLRKEGLPLELDLVGAQYPPAMRRLQRVMDRVDPEHRFIRYHGQVPYSELHHHYHSADGAVFASSCENLPSILLESMASGLPIASSMNGPMEEVLNGAGTMFDPEKPNEIASAMRTLMENRGLREEKSWAAYDRSKQYSWQRCADETFSFIAGIASQSMSH